MIAQRYYVTPPTAAEMAKALQDEPGTAVDDSTHEDGSAPVPGSEQEAPAQMTQGSNRVADADEQSWKIGCCGNYLGKRRPH